MKRIIGEALAAVGKGAAGKIIEKRGQKEPEDDTQQEILDELKKINKNLEKSAGLERVIFFCLLFIAYTQLLLIVHQPNNIVLAILTSFFISWLIFWKINKVFT